MSYSQKISHGHCLVIFSSSSDISPDYTSYETHHLYSDNFLPINSLDMTSDSLEISTTLLMKRNRVHRCIKQWSQSKPYLSFFLLLRLHIIIHGLLLEQNSFLEKMTDYFIFAVSLLLDMIRILKQISPLFQPIVLISAICQPPHLFLLLSYQTRMIRALSMLS